MHRRELARRRSPDDVGLDRARIGRVAERSRAGEDVRERVA